MSTPTLRPGPLTISDVNARFADVDASASVSPLAVVGAPAEWRDHATIYPAVVLAGTVIREHARVHAGVERHTIIGRRVLLMAGSHVGHDCVIGDDVEIAPNAVIGGLCEIGRGAHIGIGAVVRPRIRIGSHAVVGAGAVVVRDVPAGETWAGNPARKLERAA